MLSAGRFIPMKNTPMTSNRAFIIDCRITPVVALDERELARRDVSDEMQLSDMTPAEHACSEVRSSNVGKLPWKSRKPRISLSDQLVVKGLLSLPRRWLSTCLFERHGRLSSLLSSGETS